MDNKDEKTFTDLFSSSKIEPPKTTKTFSDILNNSNVEEKKDTQENITPPTSNITFDNIFDKMQTKEVENESNLFEKKEKENNTTLPIVDLGSIFDNIEEEKIENFTNNDFNNAIEQLNQTKVKNNPFPEEKDNNVTLLSNTNVELNDLELTKKEDNIETTTNVNPFFELTNSFENDLTKEQKIELPNEELNFNSNPFINVEEQEIENNDTLDDNEQKSFEVNPFFGIQTQNDEKTPEFQVTPKEDNPQNNDKKELDKEDLTFNNSTSPFFEEEKKSEENPFFQNQLNLIENQVPNNPSTNIDTTKSKHYNVKIVKKKEPLIKFILGVLSYALFIWLLLIGITLLIYVLDIKIRAAKGDYSSPTFNAYVVLTGSMLPEIQVKDVVVTKKVDASELKEGDVITFASADSRFLGTIITHRIIKKNPPTETTGYTFQTRGDNNNVADSALVPEKNIYGKVILKIPKLGYLQEFLASDGGWIIVILIPCLTVISYDIVKLIKGLKRKKYKNIKVQK